MKCSEILLRDPFVLPYRGTYYLYGTRSETAFAGEAFGFDVYQSADLIEWSKPKEIFTRPEGFWATMNYWAPEVHVYRDAFYLFATFSDGPRQGTAILRADSPEGPFVPWSDGTITPRDWRCLDGTLYIANDGTPYMVFCHEWMQVRDGQILAIRLSEDLKAPLGEPKLLFTATQGKPAIRPFLFWNYVTDGPFFFRTEDGRLHLLWSSYGRRNAYVQALAHSDNDEITGHWTVDRELLYTKDGGHGMIFRTFDGQCMLTLHSPNRKKSEHPIFIPIRYENGKLSV